MENDETQVATEPEQEDVELEEVDLEGDEPEEEPEDKDWKAEAMKYKSIAKRYKKKVVEKPEPVAEPKKQLKETKEKDPDVADRISRLEQSEKKREFGYMNGLSPEETDLVFRFNPNPTKEDLDNPFVKGGLGAIRASQKQKSNTPSSGSSAPTFKGKSFNELSEEEKEKNFEAFMQDKMKR